MSAAFPDSMHLRYAATKHGSAIFEVTKDYRVRTSRGTVIIPTGFLTDGASVPRPFWNIFQPFGKYFPAALLHDFLYSKASTQHFHFTRKESDDLFKEAMCNVKVGWLSRGIIYRSVRTFGWRSWKKR